MLKIANAVVLVAVIQVLAGCGSLPAQPDPGGGLGTGDGPVGVEQVIGTVMDSLLRPLAGAAVEVLDGPQTGATASTDAKGLFVLRATVDVSTRFGVTKDGYVTAITTARLCDGCNRFTLFFDFYLKPIGTVELAGNYTLTFVADSACTAIPIALRTRTYSVTIAPAPESAGYPAATLLLSAASDVPFWEDRNSFAIDAAGDVVVFRLGDGEYGTQYLVEEVASGQYVNFYAEQIRFSVGSTSVSTISIPFGGIAEYWGPAVANPVHCNSLNHRLILTRR